MICLLLYFHTSMAAEPRGVWNFHAMEESLYEYLQLHSIFQTTENYLNSKSSVIYNPQIQFFGEIYNELASNTYYDFQFGTGIKYQLRLIDVYKKLDGLHKQELNQTKKDWLAQIIGRINKFDADKNIIQFMEDKIVQMTQILNDYIIRLKEIEQLIMAKISGQTESNYIDQNEIDGYNNSSVQKALLSGRYKYYFHDYLKELGLPNKTNIDRKEIGFDSVVPCSNLFKNIIIVVDRWPTFEQIHKIILQSATKNDRIWLFYGTVNLPQEYLNQTYLQLQTYMYVKDYLQYLIQEHIKVTNDVLNKRDIQDLVTQIDNFEQATIYVQEQGKRITKTTNSLLLIFVNDIYLIYNSYDIIQFNKDVVAVIFTNHMQVQSYNILRTKQIYFYNTDTDIDKFLRLLNQKYYISQTQFQVINTNVIFCKSIVLNNEYIGSVFIIQDLYQYFFQLMNIWPDSVSVIQIAQNQQVVLNTRLQYFEPSIILNGKTKLVEYQVIPIYNGYYPLNISISNVIQERFQYEYFLSAEDTENYYQHQYQTLYYNKYVNQLQITVLLSQTTVLSTDRITIKQQCSQLTKDQFISELAQYQQDAYDIETVVGFATPSHTLIKKYCLNKTGRVCFNTQQQSFEYTNKITAMVQQTIANTDKSQCSFPGLPDRFSFFSAIYLLMIDRNAQTEGSPTSKQNVDRKSKFLLNVDNVTQPGLDPNLKLGNATECFTDYIKAVKALLNDNDTTQFDSIIQKYMRMLTNDINQQYDFTYFVVMNDSMNESKRISSFMEELPENQTVYFPHLFLFLNNIKNEILYYKNMAYLHQHQLSANSKYGYIYLSHLYLGSYRINVEKEVKKYCRRLLIDYEKGMLRDSTNQGTQQSGQQTQEPFNKTLYQLRERFAMKFVTFVHHSFFMFTNDNNDTRKYLIILQQVGANVDGLFGLYRLSQIDGTYYVSKPIIVTNKNINSLQQINGYVTVSIQNLDIDSLFKDQNKYIFFSSTAHVLKTNIADAAQLTLVKYIIIQQLLRINFLTQIKIRYTSYNYSQFYKINDEFWNTSWSQATINKTFTIFLYMNKTTSQNKDVFYKLLSEYEYNRTQIWERVIVVESQSNLSLVSRFSIHIPKVLQGFVIYFEEGILSIPDKSNLTFIYLEQAENVIQNTYAAIDGNIGQQYLDSQEQVNGQRSYIYSQNMTFLPMTDSLIYDSSIIYLIVTLVFTTIFIVSVYWINRYFVLCVESKQLPLMQLLNDAERIRATQNTSGGCQELEDETDDVLGGGVEEHQVPSGVAKKPSHPRDSYVGTDVDTADIQYLFRRDYIANLRGGQHLQKQVLKPNNLFTILCYDKKEMSQDESFQYFMHVVMKVRLQEQLKAPVPDGVLRGQLDGYEPAPSLQAKTPAKIGNFYDKIYPTCESKVVKKQFKLPPVQKQIPIPKFYDFEFLEMFQRDDNYTPLDVTVYNADGAVRYHNRDILDVDPEHAEEL